jgi:hypothetical protein
VLVRWPIFLGCELSLLLVERELSSMLCGF